MVGLSSASLKVSAFMSNAVGCYIPFHEADLSEGDCAFVRRSSFRCVRSLSCAFFAFPFFVVFLRSFDFLFVLLRRLCF